jgi:hypothetical protein
LVSVCSSHSVRAVHAKPNGLSPLSLFIMVERECSSIPNQPSQRRAIAQRRQRRPQQGLANGPFARAASIDPFPPRRFYELTYSNNLQVTSATFNTFGTAQTYRLNSLFDPDVTGGGTQPYGFDTLATIYKQYKVHRVRIMIEIINLDATYTGSLLCCLVPSTVTVPTLAAANIDAFLDKPFCHSINLGTSNTQVYKIVQEMGIHELDGITLSQLRNDISLYSALVTANPTNVPQLTFALASTTGTNFSVSVKTTLTFFAEMWDRFILPQF